MMSFDVIVDADEDVVVVEHVAVIEKFILLIHILRDEWINEHLAINLLRTMYILKVNFSIPGFYARSD